MSKARQKGTSFESAIVAYLKENGFPGCERWGSAEMALGDIRDVPMVLEAKNHKAMALSEWCEQASVAGKKSGKLWAVVHKGFAKVLLKHTLQLHLNNLLF